MQTRALGNTGLNVTPLGFGAMHLNDQRVSEADAGRLLNQVLDLGVNLIDTARGYGLSEERIGRHLAKRRHEFVLSTKVGYGMAGVPDWTYACIVAGVEAAMTRMRCDFLDIVHLHSCPLPILQQGEVISALEDCKRGGKLRAPLPIQAITPSSTGVWPARALVWCRPRSTSAISSPSRNVFNNCRRMASV